MPPTPAQPPRTRAAPAGPFRCCPPHHHDSSTVCLSRDKSHACHSTSFSCHSTLQPVPCTESLEEQPWSPVAQWLLHRPLREPPLPGNKKESLLCQAGGQTVERGQWREGQRQGGRAQERAKQKQRTAGTSRKADFRKWRGQARENTVLQPTFQ